jgi:hypothetical protein
MTEVVQSIVGGVRRFVATEWNGVYLQARSATAG